MAGPVSTDPVALATVDDFVRRYPILAENTDPLVIAEILVEATDQIEMVTGRRLAPFTNHTYQERLEGIDPNEYGANSGLPLPFQGSLGMSYANALGETDLVRHMWLDQYAPVHPELWTYTIESINIELTFGNTMQIIPTDGGIMGPDVTDGHVWFRIGTFIPIGSRAEVIYSGGYTVQIPTSLRRACLYQAQKFLMLENEPQQRQGINSEELDSVLLNLLAPWARA